MSVNYYITLGYEDSSKREKLFFASIKEAIDELNKRWFDNLLLVFSNPEELDFKKEYIKENFQIKHFFGNEKNTESIDKLKEYIKDGTQPSTKIVLEKDEDDGTEYIALSLYCSGGGKARHWKESILKEFLSILINTTIYKRSLHLNIWSC